MKLEENIANISRIILQNKKGMIKESDLRNLCSSNEEYVEIVKNLVKRFQNIGLSLIRSKFQGDRYYVLTSPGKDDKISPSMYGVLALLIATYNEIGDDIPLKKLSDLFKDIWDDVETLIEENYLIKDVKNDVEILEITPIGKAVMKDVIKTLELGDLIEFNKNSEG